MTDMAADDHFSQPDSKNELLAAFYSNYKQVLGQVANGDDVLSHHNATDQAKK